MIALFAPYGRNEVTAAAIRLADLVLSVGEDVRLVAVDVREQGIHSFWDRYVRSSQGDSIYQAAKGANHCVWFVCNATLHNKASLVAPRAVHTLVPPWHGLHGCLPITLRRYDRFVCPSAYHAGLFSDAVFGAKPTKNKAILAHRWDSGLPYVQHYGWMGAAPRLLVYCDASAIDLCGAMVLVMIVQLLTNTGCVDARVTMLCTKTWSRKLRTCIRELELLHGDRFECLYQRSLIDQANLFASCDIMLLPGINSDFALTAARGLACGLPVVCHAIPPFVDFVHNRRNGMLVPCAVASGPLGVATAVPEYADLAAAAMTLMIDKELLVDLQNKHWYVNTINRQFDQFWLEQLGLL